MDTGSTACKDAITYRIANSNSITWFEILLCTPTIMFIIFLIIKLKRSLSKLYKTESLIMSTYYSFIWCVSLFNVAKCFVTFFLPHYNVLYDVIYLAFHFVLIFIEVSVVIFMSHGFIISGREALTRTLWITLGISSVYSLIQILLTFVAEIHLYYAIPSAALYWFIVAILFVIAYTVILILPKTTYGEHLPTKSSNFYYYVGFLLCLYCFKCIGNLLIFTNVDIGYCLADIESFLYYASFAPLLYVCFLRDFFKEVQWPDYLYEMHMDSDT